MKLVDVTLRDGGFVNDFNWNLKEAINHVRVMQNIGIHVIEIAYWKQQAKSKNPYYAMNEEYLFKLFEKTPKRSEIAVMVDYHYCSHDPADYPLKKDGLIDILRITARKEDFEDACVFASNIRSRNDLRVSFQIINSTNYSAIELESATKVIIEAGAADIVAFADSHGNLNMSTDGNLYKKAIDLLTANSVKWGFHLHNHTGRANHNYWLIREMGCNYMDTSVNGLGKGGGNLRLEEVISNEYLPLLLGYMASEAAPQMRISRHIAYNILTGRANVTDNYRENGVKSDMSFDEFAKRLSGLRGRDKDSYDAEAI